MRNKWARLLASRDNPLKRSLASDTYKKFIYLTYYQYHQTFGELIWKVEGHPVLAQYLIQYQVVPSGQKSDGKWAELDGEQAHWLGNVNQQNCGSNQQNLAKFHGFINISNFASKLCWFSSLSRLHFWPDGQGLEHPQ